MNAVPKSEIAETIVNPDSLYTPLACAVRELRKRREDKGLARKDTIHHLLLSRPHAVMFRQIATPNYEAARFIGLAKEHGLQPMFIEFHEDRFLTMNPLKCALVRMRFSDGPGKAASHAPVVRRIANMPESDGRKIAEVATRWKQSLVSFHHEMAIAVSWMTEATVVDGSSWFHSHGRHAGEYYTPFLKLFHKAVLFEDFLLADGERSFTERIVMPAFNAATAILGEKPLIVRLTEQGEAERREWFDYPKSLLEHVDKRWSASA